MSNPKAMCKMAVLITVLWVLFGFLDSQGGEVRLLEFNLVDAIGGRASQPVADIPEGTYISFELARPGLFIRGRPGQKLYLFSFGDGWFQIREDVPSVDLVAGGGLRHFHVAELLSPERVFDGLGLRSMSLYRKKIYIGKVGDPAPLRGLGVKGVAAGFSVMAHHYDGWIWRISISGGGRDESVEVCSEALYQPRCHLGAALAGAGISVAPKDVLKGAGIIFLCRVRSAQILIGRGLVGLQDGAAVLLTSTGSGEWELRNAAIGFPLSVSVGACDLNDLGIDRMQLLRIPPETTVRGQVVSRALAMKAGLVGAERDCAVDVRTEDDGSRVRVRCGDNAVELTVDSDGLSLKDCDSR